MIDADVRSIFVHPDAWEAASADDRDDYETVARTHAVTLQMGGGASRDTVILLRSIEGVATMTFEDRGYHGTVRCGRAPWEHAVRELFDLEDPCIPAP